MSVEKYKEWLERKVREAGSQEALAARLGVQQSYISNILRGARDPAKTMLQATNWERVTSYRPKPKGQSKDKES